MTFETVFIATGTVGHFVTLAVTSLEQALADTSRRVHVFDSLQAFTLDSANSHVYKRHLARVGATMLGLPGGEGDRAKTLQAIVRVFHELHAYFINLHVASPYRAGLNPIEETAKTWPRRVARSFAATS